MYTYNQLKKYNSKICVTPTPPPPPPQGVNGAPNVPKLCVSGGIHISKSIESRSLKLSKLVDYICVCAVTNALPCNKCNFCKFNLMSFI